VAAADVGAEAWDTRVLPAAATIFVGVVLVLVGDDGQGTRGDEKCTVAVCRVLA
jgi:hypothetical protein